jgi:hypothetical protein
MLLVFCGCLILSCPRRFRSGFIIRFISRTIQHDFFKKIRLEDKRTIVGSIEEVKKAEENFRREEGSAPEEQQVCIAHQERERETEIESEKQIDKTE